MVRFSTRLAPAAPLRDELDNLFTHFFGTPDRSAITVDRSSQPPIDVWEADDACHVEAELPGVTEDQLEISALGRQLTLAVKEAEASEPWGESAEAPDEAPARKYYRRERSQRSFRRVIDFPYDIDVEQIGAKLELGILTVTVPKAATAKPRKIEVHAE